MASAVEGGVPVEDAADDTQKKRIYSSAPDTEAKLKAIEASLQQMSELQVTERETVSNPSPQRSSETSTASGPGASDGPGSIDKPVLRIQPSAGAPIDGDIPLPVRHLFAGRSLLVNLRQTRQRIELEMDRTGFTRRIFSKFPPYEYMIDMEKVIIEEIQLFCPAITRGLFLDLVDNQYAAGMETCGDDPARWAIVNALFGAAVRWRTANDSLEEMANISWAYFKNAFSVFPELLISGPDVSACEAMLTMATFLMTTADARTTCQVASSVTRTAQIAGLHMKESCDTLDTVQRSRYRRVCWVIYLFNADIMIKYGLPSSFTEAQITTELPDQGMSDFDKLFVQGGNQGSLNYPRCLAELYRIQSKIHDKLSDDALQREEGTHFQETMLSLASELEGWRQSLPEGVRPDLAAVPNDVELETPVIYLHFIYFHTLIKTHTSLARLKSLSSHTLTLCRNPSFEATEGPCPTVQQSYAKCTAAARATINLLRTMPSQSFVHLGMLCYPVTACLILLWSALEDPTGPEAHLNGRTIGQLVQFLAGLREEGCDVRGALDGCSRFLKIAKYAVHTQRAIRLSRPLDEDENVREQLEALRLKLSGVRDWMHLTQGLMSNMPTLRAQAREVFSDILDEQESDEGYGPFAPDVLKPHLHGFCYGP
ncbi:Mut3p-like fungal specific transcription factor [Colletotrichum plurivorum]|uniref:Mut3p-like fungal specific transcription factor n=1 Tax=Colletotrichum plurivorum TaxID=2175906 RepID=A0A8H6NJK0_9PEZI|nr:Mut3p-like fungal specific transcription factor [Colletotrichum plurivorum]